MKERLIFFIEFLLITSEDMSNLLDIVMYPFKNRIYEHFNVNFFKKEESDKMSAKSAHVQKTSEVESTNSPVSSSPHSPINDIEYVSISQIQLLF